MKKILIVLLVSIMIFTLTACGDKKVEEQSGNKSKIQQSENKEENNVTPAEENSSEKETQQEVKTDDNYVIFDDVENEPITEEKVVVEEVINCDGCVYAYFSDEGDKAKSLGSTLSTGEYTTDINNLKTSGGKQRHNFFGLVLSGNTISRAYSCILKNNKIYCIEGSTNGAYHNSNVAILNKIFASNQCKTLSDGHNYWCTDGSYNGNTKTNGYTSLHYETSCTIYGSDANTGKLICH